MKQWFLQTIAKSDPLTFALDDHVVTMVTALTPVLDTFPHAFCIFVVTAWVV